VLISVPPRIRLNRLFDQRSHTYLGYALTVRGSTGTESREFRLGAGQPLKLNTNSASAIQ
jgi:hypothetical protein